MSPLSFLILVIWAFSFFVKLKFCQVHSSFKNQFFSLLIFLLLFYCLFSSTLLLFPSFCCLWVLFDFFLIVLGDSPLFYTQFCPIGTFLLLHSCHFHLHEIFFRPLTFNMFVSFAMNWVSCRQHIAGYFFLIRSATLRLLIGVLIHWL